MLLKNALSAIQATGYSIKIPLATHVPRNAYLVLIQCPNMDGSMASVINVKTGLSFNSVTPSFTIMVLGTHLALTATSHAPLVLVIVFAKLV